MDINQLLQLEKKLVIAQLKYARRKERLKPLFKLDARNTKNVFPHKMLQHFLYIRYNILSNKEFAASQRYL